MSLIKSTKYAPDIFRALNGIFLVYKPAQMSLRAMIGEVRGRISEMLNEYQPRPIAKRLLIEGGIEDEKRISEVPNLADHPLVVGPRYLPWELNVRPVSPFLGYRSSGLVVLLVGNACGYLSYEMARAKFVSKYVISGRFGYITDNFFYDGKIQDKSTYKHIRSGRIDSALSRIESTQRDRPFDATAVPIDSQEAYELAKAWPKKPPILSKWPVIYKIRCTHLKLPEFKIEVTIDNERENLLAQLTHDIGLILKSGAYTESIRRVKLGPFDVENSLTLNELDLQAVIDNLRKNTKLDSDQEPQGTVGVQH